MRNRNIEVHVESEDRIIISEVTERDAFEALHLTRREADQLRARLARLLDGVEA